MKIIQKRQLTLIEIMIVMFLIMMILGVVAVNYRGALDQGKAFKSKVGTEQIQQILEFAIAQDPSLAQNVSSDWESIVASDPLVKNPASLTRDGWGEPYQVSIDGNGAVTVSSRKLDEFNGQKGKLGGFQN